jgi:hypothetical protein
MMPDWSDSKDIKPPFRTWFDINRADHREAYRYLRRMGMWPEHLVPSDHCEMDPGWCIIAAEQYVGWLERQLEVRP